MRHSAIKLEKYTFINANINTILNVIGTIHKHLSANTIH